MKLGSLYSNENRDGQLIVISRNSQLAVKATEIAPSLREALENWVRCEPLLKSLSEKLNSGSCPGAFKYDESKMASALPRSFLFADGSAFVHHIKLVRMARKAPMPEGLYTTPLMYQAESAYFLRPSEDIPQIDFSHGTDFEAEVGVIVDDVPMGVDAIQALKHIKLIVLINDVSLRGLIPEELATGFGFFQSKPNKTLSPIAVSPDELGDNWVEGRVHLPILVKLNGNIFGQPNAKEMHFHFGQLIAHAAKTRPLQAGTVIGSGTVSNENSAVGCGCLVEKRTLEVLNDGKASTSFLKEHDVVRIEMNDQNGKSLFGAIEQRVRKVSL